MKPARWAGMVLVAVMLLMGVSAGHAQALLGVDLSGY